MPLTEGDIKRFQSAGKSNFYIRTQDGYIQLKNVHGHCIFLGDDGKCTVYDIRPEGCRVYPWVYNEEKGSIEADVDCPYSEEFEEGDIEEIMTVVSKIEIEKEKRLMPHTDTLH